MPRKQSLFALRDAQARTSRRSPQSRYNPGIPPSSAWRCTHLTAAKRQRTSLPRHWRHLSPEMGVGPSKYELQGPTG